MEECRMRPNEIGTLLVTSEAPPRLAGLAAELHHRLDLPPRALAFEVGGACTGFLAAMWLGRALLASVGAVMILGIEAHSRYLTVAPGLGGEAAALFGDGVAAALLAAESTGADAVPLRDVTLACHGEAADLIRVVAPTGRGIELRMDGQALANRAVRAIIQSVRNLAGEHSLSLNDLEGVAIHGGNGRMPGLIARQLGLPAERVWSCTSETGNLGSVSVPAAWAARPSPPHGLVIWTTAGAGLTSGAALTGAAQEK
jgi:3-oxoacyl-[acyl-carrier-protein] synthase-3